MSNGQDNPKIESVILASADYSPVRIDQMTLEQAREAIHVLGAEIISLNETKRARFLSSCKTQMGKTIVVAPVEAYIRDVNTAVKEFSDSVKALIDSFVDEVQKT